jgi:head-tail adaptor
MITAGDLRDRLTFQQRAEFGQDYSIYLIDEFGRRFVDELGRFLVAQKGGQIGGPTDVDGNPVAGGWEIMFSVDAKMHPLRGGEEVIAARLTGVQPFIASIRRSPKTKRITTDWRCVDARNPLRIFNIRAIQDSDDGRRHGFDLVLQEGVAT